MAQSSRRCMTQRYRIHPWRSVDHPDLWPFPMPHREYLMGEREFAKDKVQIENLRNHRLFEIAKFVDTVMVDQISMYNRGRDVFC